ncbi:MAG: hypothetical protein HC883_00070 [Bdellovibrionaceae bacterium]|nr:hypothetical protein [Pseudobdellovibrionaceae bacterium]
MSIKVISNSSASAPSESATEAREEQQNTSASAENQTDETAEESETSEADSIDESEATKSGGDDQAEQLESEDRGLKTKKPGFVKRIDKLTKRLSEKDRELEYWREQALKGTPQEPTESTPQTKQASSERPKSEDFDTHEAYVEAVADWKVEQRFKAQEAKAKETSLQGEFQRQRDEYKTRATAFAKENPDFVEAVNAVDDIPLSVTVSNAILKHGPELAYELAKDPEELERICALSVLDAAEAIGEIRARMKASKTESKPETRITKAPKPLTPIASKSASVKKSLSDPNLSQREYERMREEQESRRA